MTLMYPVNQEWVFLYSEASRLVRAAEVGRDGEHLELHNLIEELLRLHDLLAPVVNASGWRCQRKFK